jgi:hypothetical protein
MVTSSTKSMISWGRSGKSRVNSNSLSKKGLDNKLYYKHKEAYLGQTVSTVLIEQMLFKPKYR